MKVLGLGMPELLIILAVALLIFGPKHLPKLGSAIGATVKNLRTGLSDGDKEKEEVIDEIEEDEEAVEKPARQKIEGSTAKKTTTKKTTTRKKAPVKEEVVD